MTHEQSKPGSGENPGEASSDQELSYLLEQGTSADETLASAESPADGGYLIAEIVDPATGQGGNAREIGQTGGAAVIPNAELVVTPATSWNQELPPVLQNFAAVGGAIGALVLGTWSILGALLTPYSGINGLIGLILGVWGLSSRKKQIAIIGIVLSVAGIGMSVMKVSEIISIYWNTDDGL